MNLRRRSVNVAALSGIFTTTLFLCLTTSCLWSLAYGGSNSTTHGESAHEKSHGGVKVASFKFEYVKAEIILTIFIVVIGVFKLLYHQFKYPQALVPESCCLIILGTLLGLCFLWLGSSESVRFLEFDSKVFFFILLPPIILEAAYSLNDRAFIDNLGTILLYAVLGTVLNITIISTGLILLQWWGVFGKDFGIHILDSLLFSSLIAAVDPVAVLAIFKEVGVNKMLYFMVFGESLLNDAVTVVCYNLVNEFRELGDAITPLDCLFGLLAFLCVSLGGLSIGLAFGVLSSFITRFTIHVRVVEPVVCFGMAYLAYVCSELFHFSGIIGIIAAGLFQTHYTFSNLSVKSQISIDYITKVVSSVSESLIFIILGVMLVNERSWFWSDWHPTFSLYSLLLCIGARFLVVFSLTYIVNRFTGGVRYISRREQVIMAYGGLRGAVSFSLAFMLPDEVETKSTLLAATYVVILFTVFGQGCSIKFLVKWLNIRLARKEDNFRLFNAFNRGMVTHMTQGIEDIIGVKDYSVMSHLSKMSRRYLRPLLQRDYVEKRTEDRLILIENEETFKESLRSSPSKPSLLRQHTVENMVQQGSATVELFDEHQDNHLIACHASDAMSKKGKTTAIERTAKEVEQMTKDTMQIQALFTGGAAKNYYPDRNLVDEEAKERQHHYATTAYSQQMSRLVDMREMSESKHRRRLLGFKRASRKKVSVTRGMLAVAVPSVGLTSSASQSSSLGGMGATNHGTNSNAHSTALQPTQKRHLPNVVFKSQEMNALIPVQEAHEESPRQSRRPTNRDNDGEENIGAAIPGRSETSV